jgi:hypothetical protein
MPSYPETSAEFNSESGRSINNAPRNKSTGSSAEYNYSSAKLDRSDWNRGITVRRDRRRRVALLPFFWAWLAEATAIAGYLPRGLPPLATWRVRWQWDGFESIDPVKDAQARQIELQSGQTTLDDVCAEKGRDWEEVLHQKAREKKLADDLGLPEERESESSVSTEDADGNRTTVSRTAKKSKVAESGVQETALNGAQIASLVAVCDKLVLKQYSEPATQAILEGSFPGIDRGLIQTIVKELGKHVPPKPVLEEETVDG